MQIHDINILLTTKLTETGLQTIPFYPLLLCSKMFEPSDTHGLLKIRWGLEGTRSSKVETVFGK